MPYLHWATTSERLKTQNSICGVPPPRLPLPGSDKTASVQLNHYTEHDPYRKLLNTYLSGDCPLHIRLTLDQFYYTGLDDQELEYRDANQTITKYAEEYSEDTEIRNNPPLLMVDQLWLWVLDNRKHSAVDITRRHISNLNRHRCHKLSPPVGDRWKLRC